MKCDLCSAELPPKRRLYCSDKCGNRARYMRSLEASIAVDCATAVGRWGRCLDWKASLEGTRGLRRMLIERSVHDAALGLEASEMDSRRVLDKKLLSQPRTCENATCRKPFHRNKGEDPSAYVRRVFCCIPCAFESVKHKQAGTAGVEEHAP